jgi:hypothetical protein
MWAQVLASPAQVAAWTRAGDRTACPDPGADLRGVSAGVA